MNLNDLKTPLPKIHWRAQMVSKKDENNPKAMALAYMDARDVMDRLDAVCGPENWQDSYVESAKGRVICTISILIGDQWVSKSDGAGDTAVEGEKGGISDAFKRAAVKWGIGRYLYAMKTPWAACELYNGKWARWTPEGLAYLNKIHAAYTPPAEEQIEAPRPDPVPPPTNRAAPSKCSAADVKRIQELAKAAGKDISVVTDNYLVKELSDLTADQAEAAIKRLKITIDQAKEKETT